MICPHCAHNNLPGEEQCSHCLHDLTQLDRPTAQDRVERSLMEDTVAMLGPRQAVTLPATASVKQAVHTMLAWDIGAVLIVDEGGRLVGIFSERDLLTRVAREAHDATARPVRDFMTPRPETVRDTDTLAFALHKMDGGGYRHLPVVQGDRPTGMVSVRDLLRHIMRLCKGCGG
jgi:CBS domain-containing protein